MALTIKGTCYYKILWLLFVFLPRRNLKIKLLKSFKNQTKNEKYNINYFIIKHHFWG